MTEEKDRYANSIIYTIDNSFLELENNGDVIVFSEGNKYASKYIFEN